MVLQFGSASGSARYAVVKDEVAKFRRYFKKLVLEFAFKSFVERMAECVDYFNNIVAAQTIIVLNIYGSIVDLTEMLAASCATVKEFEYFVASSQVHPLEFYRNSLKKLETIPLIFIPNEVSEQHLSCLVEILSTEKSKAVLAVAINDSHSVSLCSELEAKVCTQIFTMPDPLLCVREVLSHVAFTYSSQNAMIISPAVLKDAHIRFVENTLSFLDLENYLSLCIARAALGMKELLPLKKRLKTDPSIQLTYIFCYSLFHELNTDISKLKRFDEFMQFSHRYFEGSMNKMKAFYSQNPAKFKTILDDFLSKQTLPSTPLTNSLLKSLNSVSEEIGKTKWITQSDLIKQNLSVKPSQRKGLGKPNTSTFAPIFDRFEKALLEGVNCIDREDQMVVTPQNAVINIKIKCEDKLNPVIRNLVSLGMM